MPHEFTAEQIRMLAEVERMMDRGEMPFVIWRGLRSSVLPEVMIELGLEQGQTVTDILYDAILAASIRLCEREIAKRNPN